MLTKLERRARAVSALVACASLWLCAGSAGASDQAHVEVVRGSSAEVAAPGDPPGLELHRVRAPAGIAVSQIAATSDLRVDVEPDVQLGTYEVRLEGTQCPVRPDVFGGHELLRAALCVLPYDEQLRVAVLADTAEVASPSRERLDAARQLTGGGVELRDELVVALGPANAPEPPAVARRLAEDVGARVEGGIEDLGTYQFVWPEGVDVDALRRDLASRPGIAVVSGSQWETAGELSMREPSEMDDLTPDEAWWLWRVNAPAAWARTERPAVPVGVVDSGVDAGHSDLDVIFDSPQAGHRPDDHGTHVAGIACGRGDNGGIVGIGRGCAVLDGDVDRLTAAGLKLSGDLPTLHAMNRVLTHGARVVNVSQGWKTLDADQRPRCASQAEADSAALEYDDPEDDASDSSALYRRLYNSPLGRTAVFTLAAGNSCVRGVQHGIQRGAHDLAHVLVVAASNGSGTLARFSNWGAGIEIAAPGGVREGGGSLAGVYSAISGDRYDYYTGTSMAAPVVAGAAAFLRGEFPDYSPNNIVSCLLEGSSRARGIALTVRSEEPRSAAAVVTPQPGELSSLYELEVAGAFRACSGDDEAPTGHRFAQLGLGNDHTCAVDDDRRLHCIGSNSYGQLGRGGTATVANDWGPTVLEEVGSIAALGHTTCATRVDGSAWCWGDNTVGQLGLGYVGSPPGGGPYPSTPARVTTVDDGAVVGGGVSHRCVIHADRTLSCWGLNNYGQLGRTDPAPNEANDSREAQAASGSPAPVAGVDDAAEVVGGFRFTCARLFNGRVPCWGDNRRGQLGRGFVGGYSTDPVSVPGVSDAVDVAAGGHFACALRANGEVLCWGDNNFGQLGTGTKSPPVPTATRVSGLGPAVAIGAGGGVACARAAEGLWCWGFNSDGQVGDGTETDRPAPVRVGALTETPVDFRSGSAHTCATTTEGNAFCWGKNWTGQLANGRGAYPERSLSPVRVLDLP